MVTVKACRHGCVYYFKAEHRADAETLVGALELAGFTAEIWS